LLKKFKLLKALESQKEPSSEELKELESELYKSSVRFPQNQTFRNYVDFLFIPTFVYELEYPRTPRIRPFYLLEKCFAFTCAFMLLYITTEHYIEPVMLNIPHETIAESLLQLMMPFVVGYLLLFFIIFECVCNFFAEVTQFADRGFYEGVVFFLL
jgi:sterol O-acyltransferase